MTREEGKTWQVGHVGVDVDDAGDDGHLANMNTHKPHHHHHHHHHQPQHHQHPHQQHQNHTHAHAQHLRGQRGFRRPCKATPNQNGRFPGKRQPRSVLFINHSRMPGCDNVGHCIPEFRGSPKSVERGFNVGASPKFVLVPELCLALRCLSLTPWLGRIVLVAPFD